MTTIPQTVCENDAAEPGMLRYSKALACLPNTPEVTMPRTATSTLYRIRRSSEPVTGQTRVLEGDALVKDMRAYGKKVSASPAAARKFLTELGVLTADGKRKNLIRE